MDVATVAASQQQTVGALVGNGLAGHNASGGLGQSHTGGLENERHGTGSTRVGFDDVQRVGHEGVLHVDQTLHVAAGGDGVGAFAQTANLVVGQRRRRQGAGGVAGMDAGFLDVFHNAADVQLLAVKQRIDIDFDGILQELIDQQRGGQTARDHSIGLGLGKRAIHVLVELLVVINDFHAAATENVAQGTSTG